MYSHIKINVELKDKEESIEDIASVLSQSCNDVSLIGVGCCLYMFKCPFKNKRAVNNEEKYIICESIIPEDWIPFLST